MVALTAAVVTVIVAALRRHGGFDWSLFASTLLGVRWPWLVVAACVALATYAGRALRWAALIRHLKPGPSLWGLCAATAIGFAAIFVLGRPGELVRPYLISVKEKLSFSSQLAAWLLERICDLLSALLIFAFALVEVERSGAKVGPGLRWAMETGGYVAGAVGVFSVSLVLVLRQFSQSLRQRLGAGLEVLPGRWRTKAAELMESFLQGIEATRSRTGLLEILWYTALEWGLIVMVYVTLFRAFPELDGLGLADILMLIGFVAFGSLVQIPGVGGGVQVVSILVLSEVFKLPLETATGVALMVWIMTFVVVVPVGLVLFVREGLNWQKIREIRGEIQP